jgi:hypothetical protein
MTKALADVNEWLNGAREFSKGLTLWQKHKASSKRKWLEGTLTNGPDPVSSSYLLEELQFMNGESKEEEVGMLPAQVRQRKRLELADHKDAPQKILEARREFKEVMTSINILRTEVRMSEGVKDRKWRAHRAQKIVSLTRERRRLLDLFHVYDKTGEVPQEDMVLMLRSEVKAMIEDYKNHTAYVGSNGSKKQYEVEVLIRRARLNEIQEFLRT